ncbi:helix-turn-helix domain-containing protein [Neobacillus drentensis]|uniref:helix-turn-helix domain-containing protein n=1 Tax=Neobacillus drentensis TaxID=220684 RepID=UPI000826A7CA|nr:helix-turn-helix domain-containing protein [Neobacillus drentensis]
MKIEYSVIILALSIAFSGFWIGNALKQDNALKSDNVEMTLTDDTLSISEAAAYLKISEDSIKRIIKIERVTLEQSGSFDGMMFPYSKIYDQYVFSKKSLDQWIQEKVITQSVYSVEGVQSR